MLGIYRKNDPNKTLKKLDERGKNPLYRLANAFDIGWPSS
ncbi:hypothetical protein IFVP182_C2140002 [Vibrio parahaemolyticus]